MGPQFPSLGPSAFPGRIWFLLAACGTIRTHSEDEAAHQGARSCGDSTAERPPHEEKIKMSRTEHWNRVYTTKAEREVSWFQEMPAVSLELLEAAGLATNT